MSRKNIAVAGAGFSGAVIAHLLANAGHEITVFEERSHLAGNSHTERDPETGVMIHVYGPHIFHTDNERVWEFINRFDRFMPYVNRVKAVTRTGVYSLPINLHTINQFFGKVFRPAEAYDFIQSVATASIENPVSFEEQALRFIGKDLYEEFFKGYTIKQWGMHPAELPASILKRLPIRFNYDDNYYNHKFQGMPENGYTAAIERMLDLPGINIHVNTSFDPRRKNDFDHVFYTGPLDSWFERLYGQLPYRTLDFMTYRGEGDYQGNAVINYCDQAVPYTRITEHKHFAPWESHGETIVYKEFSRLCREDDIPYYPIRLTGDTPQLLSYVELAREERNVTFVGRLATYRYLDMDATIDEAISVAETFLRADHAAMPPFCVNPLC